MSSLIPDSFESLPLPVAICKIASGIRSLEGDVAALKEKNAVDDAFESNPLPESYAQAMLRLLETEKKVELLETEKKKLEDKNHRLETSVSMLTRALKIAGDTVKTPTPTQVQAG